MIEGDESLQWAPRVRFAVLDALVILLALALVIGAWPLLFGFKGHVAEIWIDGKPRASLQLTGKEREFEVNGHLGRLQLSYGHMGVRVKASPCLNQICVRQGFVHRQGARLTCLPSRVVVALPRATAHDGVTY